MHFLAFILHINMFQKENVGMHAFCVYVLKLLSSFFWVMMLSACVH